MAVSKESKDALKGSGEKMSKIKSGILNPKRGGVKGFDLGYAPRGILSSAAEVVKNSAEGNILSGLGPYKGIVLRVILPSFGEPSSGWEAAMQKFAQAEGAVPKGRVKVVARIPEIHESLPHPSESDFKRERSRQGKSAAFKTGVVDLHPIFIAENDEVPPPNVGDIVWLNFENTDTMTGGIYLGPVISGASLPADSDKNEEADSANSPSSNPAGKSAKRALGNNAKLASKYKNSSFSGAGVSEGVGGRSPLKADPDRVKKLIKDKKYPNAIYFNWEATKTINRMDKGYKRRSFLNGDTYYSYRWKSMREYVRLGGSKRSISGELKLGYIKERYPNYSILSKYVIGLRIAIEDQAGRGYQLANDCFCRSGGVDCDGFVLTARNINSFLIAGDDHLLNEEVFNSIREDLFSKHSVIIGGKMRNNVFGQRRAKISGMSDQKMFEMVEDIIRNEGDAYSDTLGESFNSMVLYYWMYRNAHLDRSAKSTNVDDDPIKQYVKSMKKAEMSGLLYDYIGLVRSKKSGWYVVLDKPHWSTSPRRWVYLRYSSDEYGWRILPKKSHVSRVGSYPKKRSRGRYSSFDRYPKYVKFNSKEIHAGEKTLSKRTGQYVEQKAPSRNKKPPVAGGKGTLEYRESKRVAKDKAAKQLTGYKVKSDNIDVILVSVNQETATYKFEIVVVERKSTCQALTTSCPVWEYQTSINPLPGDVLYLIPNKVTAKPGRFPNYKGNPCCVSHIAVCFAGPDGELRIAESGGPFSGTGSLTWAEFVEYRFGRGSTFSVSFQQPPEMSGVWLKMKREHGSKLSYPGGDYEGRPTCTWDEFLSANAWIKDEILAPTKSFLGGDGSNIPNPKKYHDVENYMNEEILKDMIQRTCGDVCKAVGCGSKNPNGSRRVGR